MVTPRIFRHGVPSAKSPTAQRASSPRVVEPPETARPPQRDPAPTRSSIVACVERSCIEIIEAPLAYGETLEMAYRRKEQELRAVFAALTVLESRDMHRRLSNPTEGDILAMTFGRMVADRRARLLTFLADARRREAIASARRV